MKGRTQRKKKERTIPERKYLPAIPSQRRPTGGCILRITSLGYGGDVQTLWMSFEGLGTQRLCSYRFPQNGGIAEEDKSPLSLKDVLSKREENGGSGSEESSEVSSKSSKPEIA